MHKHWSTSRWLIAGFGLLAALTVLQAVFVHGALSDLRGRFDDVRSQHLARYRLASTGQIELGLAVQEFKNALLRGDPRYADGFRRHLAGIDAVVKDYRALGNLEPDETAALDSIARNVAVYRDAIGKVETMRAQNASIPEMDKSIKGADRPIAEALGRLRKNAGDRADAGGLAFDAAIGTNQRMTALVGGVMLVIALVAGVLITRRITRPLAAAVAAAADLAAGRFEGEIRPAGTAETARLLEAMRNARDQVKGVIEAQQRLAGQHDAGAIDARIEAGTFPGAFGTMAERTNALVDSHVALQFEFAKVVQAYGRGDFSRDLPALPGRKAEIAAAAAAVKSGLVRLADEIRRLAEAAARGDFSVRGDATAFEARYAEIITAMNAVMEAAEAGLGDARGMFQAIAAGDLTPRVTRDCAGTFDALKRHSNETMEAMSRLVASIRTSAESIDTAAREIADGNANLSSRTEEQASSLEETASSMEELTGTVRQNASTAQSASQLARQASEQAVRVGTEVSEAVAAMHEVRTSSQRVQEIIAVIDGIAFQTNILALNAAVEAARAGEQGRGFAVVATEVRTLAQRSSAAAKEIRELIAGAVSRVGDGAERVERVGASMTDVVEAVRRVTDMIGEIAAAAGEQSAGIEQVSTAVSQMDQVTQQNAALVEEAAAAAESLREQAGQLVEAVRVFRVEAAAARVASRDKGMAIAA